VIVFGMSDGIRAQSASWSRRRDRPAIVLIAGTVLLVGVVEVPSHHPHCRGTAPRTRGGSVPRLPRTPVVAALAGRAVIAAMLGALSARCWPRDRDRLRRSRFGATGVRSMGMMLGAAIRRVSIVAALGTSIVPLEMRLAAPIRS